MANVAFLTERMRLGFGVDLVVDRVAAGLVARGHDVTVYASYEDGTYRDRPYTLASLGVPATRYAPLYDLEAVRRAHRFALAARGHDLFLIETPPFFALLPWLRDRAVAVDHGVIDSRGFPLAARANFAFVRAAQHHLYFPFANRIVTVSEFLRRSLPARLRDRTTTIHNGADHYPPAPAEESAALRARLGIDPQEVMVLYVGRVNPAHQPYKGTGELARTWTALAPELPGARLVMAGFGTEEDAAWVRSFGAVPFVNVPVGDMPALYGAADLFVTASRWEGFNLNLVEAQRAGVPVVAFRVGAHPEVVDDGSSGLLVHSSRGFADAIRELVRDEGRRRQMGRRARDVAARFTWEAAVARYEAVIADALAAKLTRPAEARPAGP